MQIKRKNKFDWINIGLTIFYIVVAIYIIAPLIIVVMNSFNSVSYNIFPPIGFSLKWYKNVFVRPEFVNGFKISLIVGIISSLISVFAALLAALALVRYHFRAASILRSFFLSPVVVPKVVIGLSFFIMYLKLKMFGTIYSLIAAHVVVTMPFALAVLIGIISSLNPVLEEAAEDLGASTSQIILKIILPQIKIGLLISAIFAFIISWDQIDTTIFLVRPAINTLPVEMFIYLERWQDPSMAALSTILILFSLLILLIVRPMIGTFTSAWNKRN